MNDNRLILYDGHDLDGWGAYWASQQSEQWRGARAIPVAYQEPPPAEAKGKDLLILDFCYPPEELKRLHAANRSVLVIDHHISAAREWAEETGAHFEGSPHTFYFNDNLRYEFDLNRSAAGMAWDYLVGNEPPWLIKYVEDRDLWKFELPHSRAVHAHLRALPLDLPTWDALGGMGEPDQQFIATGNTLIHQMNGYIRVIAQFRAKEMIAKHWAYAVNCPPSFISDLAHHLLELAEASDDASLNNGGKGYLAAVWFDHPKGYRKYSLRSSGEVDAGAIAQLYGGGGHKHAAGFKTPYGGVWGQETLEACSVCGSTDIEVTNWTFANGSWSTGAAAPTTDVWCPTCSVTSEVDTVAVNRIKTELFDE
jgi:oligoribonuclease NrnB/cAMP/cGMP phosphodiesterase (DHH superfamily)